VSTDYIASPDSALVVSDYKNNIYNAAVVSLTAGGNTKVVDSMFKNIYLGSFDRIYSAQFDLANYSQIKGLKFEDLTTSNRKTLGYGTDTVITDVTTGTAKSLTPYDLFNGGYTTDENPSTSTKTDTGLSNKSWYTFVVTDDNGDALSMMLRKYGLLANQDIDNTAPSTSDQRTAIQTVISQLTMTRGTVNSIDTTNSRIQLNNSSDYSNLQQQWSQNRVNTYVTIGDTIIMRDKKTITLSDLKVGDRLSIVRAKANAVVVFVED